MLLSTRRFLFVAMWVITADAVHHAQTATAPLQQLVDTSAKRLVIAEQVALAKWDDRAPVEDDSREARVIARAVEEGRRRGLDRASISRFFRAQIEASKLVQYSLLAEWSRTGTAPSHTRVDLVKTIRPELDRLDTVLIAALADTVDVRVNGSCRDDVAKAVGAYVATHASGLNPVEAIALDRAMAGSCP